jgi:Na+/melibiose symporter-like transporter
MRHVTEPHRRVTGEPGSLELSVFAAIAIPLAGAGLPLAVYLPAFYAQELGLGLALVGGIFMLSRIWDAVTDPLVGILSDRTRTRFGRRKPWIAAGAPIFILATVAIFMPGLFGVTPGGVWLAVWLGIFYVGWTVMQIPFSAWAGELSARYHTRSRVQTFVHVATALGLVLVLVVPAALDQVWAKAGVVPDPQLKIAAMGMFILATFIPALICVLLFVREPVAPPLPIRRVRLPQVVFEALRDPLLRRVLGSDFSVTLGQLTRSSLFVFFVSAYMGRPDLAAGLFLLQFVFGVLAGPIWLKIGYRFGKHQTAVIGESVQILINLALLLVMPDNLALLLVLTVCQGLAQGSGNLMLRAIVADVADHQRLQSGEDRTGLLYSIFSLTSKAATAAAVGISLPLVGALGFRPGAENTPEALENLKYVFAIGPACAHLVSAVLIARFPLDQARHTEIRKALDDPSAHQEAIAAE